MPLLRADMKEDVLDMAIMFEQMCDGLIIPRHISLMVDDANGMKAPPQIRPPTACQALEWFALRLVHPCTSAFTQLVDLVCHRGVNNKVPETFPIRIG